MSAPARLRAAARAAKARLVRVRPARRPVLIMGLRRGGTTMVADAVAGTRGVWFADEPFAVLPGRALYAHRRARLPEAAHSHFFDLHGEDLARFAAYTRELLEGRPRLMGTARAPHGLLGADRVCLKVLSAPWMIDWFLEASGADIVTILRHPGAQAVSVLRRDWGFPVEAYLARPESLARHFTPRQITLAREIFNSGDRWCIAILDWVITGAGLRAAPEGPHHRRLAYESVVHDPAGFVDATLVGWLGLAGRARMLEGLSRPSSSSRLSTPEARAAILGGDREALLEGWRREVDPAMLAAGQRILDSFGIGDYDFSPAG